MSNNDAQCTLCGDPASSIAGADRRAFLHCVRCDLVCVPSSEHLKPAQEHERYLLHENSIDDARYVATFDGVIAQLAAHAPNARRVLDYGSGPTPVLVELLRRLEYDVTGYDPYFAPDADLSVPFDSIVSVETFEHFCEPRVDLRRLVSMLAPGAALIVKTRFHRGADTIADWWYARDPTHVAFYSVQTMEWIAAKYKMRLAHCNGESLARFVAPAANSSN